MTPEKSITYNGAQFFWVECLEDFAGNSRQPGFWADLWQSREGKQVVTLGGYGWIEFAGAEFGGSLENEKRMEETLIASHIFNSPELLRIFRTEKDPLRKIINLVLKIRYP